MRHPKGNESALQIKHYLNKFNVEVKGFIPEIMFSPLIPFVSAVRVSFSVDTHIHCKFGSKESLIFRGSCESISVHG